jgi:threonylcarbamoyladenosine tRNA methylthiotransferase MtaB
MRRRYRSEWYRNRVEAIKRRDPSAGVGADVIVGFPGETHEMFEETSRFIADIPLSYLHVFPYSERRNTPAPEYHDQVEPRIRFERAEILRRLGMRKRRAFHEMFLGTVQPVLIESSDQSGTACGLTREYVRVRIPELEGLTGTIVPVRILEPAENSCIGRVEEISPALAAIGDRIGALEQ